MFRKTSTILRVVIVLCSWGLAPSARAGTAPRIEWQRTYGGPAEDRAYSVYQTTDGGYIITGCTASTGAGALDVWLIKTDADGNLVWDKTFGGASNDYGHSVQQTTDGGYVIGGETETDAYGPIDVYVIKTDSGGNATWQYPYGGAARDYCRAIKQTADGGYVIGGKSDSLGNGHIDVYILKISASGGFLWQYGYGGTRTDGAYNILETQDGGYAASGWTDSFDVLVRDAYLVKTDSEGHFSWGKTYGDFGDDRTQGSCETTDGGFALAGFSNSFEDGKFNAMLIRTDSQGNRIWQKTYGGPYDDLGHRVRQTSDGGFILIGETDSTGLKNYHIYVVGTDENGNQEWTISCAGTGDETPAIGLKRTSLPASAATRKPKMTPQPQTVEPAPGDDPVSSASVRPCADGGYIIAGWTTAFGAGDYDAFVMKIGPPRKPASAESSAWTLYSEAGTNNTAITLKRVPTKP
jgi:hypothetical protein